MSDRFEIDYEGQLRGRLARILADEARKRKKEPAALMADIIELVIEDNLFAAILD